MNVSADQLLEAYSMGIFPMGHEALPEDLYWLDPEKRGILPLDSFHIPRSLQKVLRRNPFEIRINTEFRTVMECCAAPAPKRPETWINKEILRLYCDLHARGFAHSVETWSEGKLVGGLYGVSLGGAFFGESMFSRVPNASKVALVYLVKRLRCTGFTLLDAQFTTKHLEQFGAVEIPRGTYKALLQKAIARKADFTASMPEIGKNISGPHF